MIFKNLNPLCQPKGLSQLIKWKLTTPSPKWPQNVPIQQYDIPPSKVTEKNQIRISFVGHVTFLIQANNLNILTDPVWSERASPFQFIGPKRVSPPGISFEYLPKIDLILISHNHYDHLDLTTIEKLWKLHKPIIITPLQNDTILKKHIPNIKVLTLNWEEKAVFNSDLQLTNELLGSKLSITLKPAQHWSARGLFDINQALWGSFIIDLLPSDVGSIFFVGDSGYDQDLYRKIGIQHKIFLSLLPIGAFAPRWFMQDVHMDPNEAVLTYKDLKTSYAIASHFKTFPLASDDYQQPVDELCMALIKNNISLQKFIVPEIGQAYHFTF